MPVAMCLRLKNSGVTPGQDAENRTIKAKLAPLRGEYRKYHQSGRDSDLRGVQSFSPGFSVTPLAFRPRVWAIDPNLLFLSY